MKARNTIFGAILCMLAGLALLPRAQAVVPAPDGFYPGFNTAEGQNALFSLDINNGFANTAVGWSALRSNVVGDFNTANGAGSLLFNTGENNTAFGAAALLFNTTGAANTAVGAAALLNNTDGVDNNAVGVNALSANTIGDFNNAHGNNALLNNVNGNANNAFGDLALVSTVSGSANTAIGDDALLSCTGDSNVAVGHGAGSVITTGNNIIAIGAGVSGVSTQFGEVDDSCYIGNIYGAVISDNAAFVFVDADGKVGTGAVDAKGNKVTLPSPQAMLNEFLKGQKRLAELEATVAQQAQAMEVLMGQLKEQAAQIQKVSAKVEMKNSAPHLVLK